MTPMTPKTTPKLLAALALTTLGLTAPLAARADIPPGPDFVETCTVDNQTTPGHECRSCNAWHGDVDACVNSLGKEGFTKACQGYGASTWSEVWCRATTATEPPKPETTDGPTPAVTVAPKTSGSKCAGGGVELGAGLAFALMVLARRARLASL